MMNQQEKICQSYQNDVRCFENIPHRFEFDGRIHDDCSFIFPPGYSMHLEVFVLNNPGPDNFVLNGEAPIGYESKLKWEDRIQSFWKKMDKDHPLYKKANLRVNRCVKTLKVTEPQIFFNNFQ